RARRHGRRSTVLNSTRCWTSHRCFCCSRSFSITQTGGGENRGREFSDSELKWSSRPESGSDSFDHVNARPWRVPLLLVYTGTSFLCDPHYVSYPNILGSPQRAVSAAPAA